MLIIYKLNSSLLRSPWDQNWFCFKYGILQYLLQMIYLCILCSLFFDFVSFLMTFTRVPVTMSFCPAFFLWEAFSLGYTSKIGKKRLSQLPFHANFRENKTIWWIKTWCIIVTIDTKNGLFTLFSFLSLLFFLMVCVPDSFKIQSNLWSYAGERRDSDWLMPLKQHILLAHNRCPYGNMIVFSHMTWVTNFGYVCGRFGSSACSQTLTKISLSHSPSDLNEALFQC